MHWEIEWLQLWVKTQPCSHNAAISPIPPLQKLQPTTSIQRLINEFPIILCWNGCQGYNAFPVNSGFLFKFFFFSILHWLRQWIYSLKYLIKIWPRKKMILIAKILVRGCFRKRLVIGQTRTKPAFGWIWLATSQAGAVGWWLINEYSYERSARLCLAQFVLSGSSEQNV